MHDTGDANRLPPLARRHWPTHWRRVCGICGILRLQRNNQTCICHARPKHRKMSNRGIVRRTKIYADDVQNMGPDRPRETIYEVREEDDEIRIDYSDVERRVGDRRIRTATVAQFLLGWNADKGTH